VKSRYVHVRDHKIPRHRRSRKVAGAEEEYGRYIKCWNCGAILDTKRLSTGDGSGISVEEADSYSYPTEGVLNECSLDNLSLAGDVDLLDSGGSERVTLTPRFSRAVSGCWFCGCKNLP
jgi:hypothetical protein